LSSDFNQEALIIFYVSLPVSPFWVTQVSAKFCSIYTCEQAFPRMKQNKSKLRSRITDVHLQLCDAK
jgi:hypothetical protein